MPRNNTNDVSPVAPIESVKDESVKAEPVEVTDKCWNCFNQGDLNQLDSGKCAVCGFDKSLLYNLELEEARSKQINASKG